MSNQGFDWHSWSIAAHSNQVLDNVKTQNQDEDEENKKEIKIETNISKELANIEHRGYKNLSICASLSQLQLYVGINVRWYFVFLRCSLIANIFIGLFGLAIQVLYINELSEKDWYTKTPYHWLSISSLDSKLEPYWYVLTALSYVVCVTYPLLYRLFINRNIIPIINKNGKKKLDLNNFDDPVNGRELDEIVKNPTLPDQRNHNKRMLADRVNPPVKDSIQIKHYENLNQQDEYNSIPVITNIVNHQVIIKHKYKRIMGYALSIFIFFGLLTIQGYVNYSANIRYSDVRSQLLVSASLSIALTIANVLWQLLSYFSTFLEQHASMREFNKSYFLKTYIFRMSSTLLLFCISQLKYFNHNSFYANVSTEYPSCPYERLTQLYSVTLLMEIVSSIISTLVVMPIQRRIILKCCRKSYETENDFMPEFSIPEEFSDLLYKQFLVMLGLPVFPTIGFWMCFVLMSEWLFDRIKLIKFSKPVPRTTNTFKNILFVVNLFNVILAICVPPNGFLWVIFGFRTNCAFSF